AVVDAGADCALDVGERGVDDLDVEHRHERAERGANHGDPGLGRYGRRDGRGGSGKAGSVVDRGLKRAHGNLVSDAETGCVRRMGSIISKVWEGSSGRI